MVAYKWNIYVNDSELSEMHKSQLVCIIWEFNSSVKENEENELLTPREKETISVIHWPTCVMKAKIRNEIRNVYLII